MPDHIGPRCRVLFVGINPGLRSALMGHHYAGAGNRFWRALFEAGLVKEKISCTDDGLLPKLGFGLTNLIEKPTRGSADLSRGDFEAGRRKLRAKILKVQPKFVAFVGLTAYRAYFGATGPIPSGLRNERIGRTRVFVLPNTSGRNAHFNNREMTACFAALREELERVG